MLRVTAPPLVAVGAPFTVNVRCALVLPRRTVRASLVHLFIEITDSHGVGVRWQARSTNLLGDAAFQMVALDAPGRFAVHIYAGKSGLFLAENLTRRQPKDRTASLKASHDYLPGLRF